MKLIINALGERFTILSLRSLKKKPAEFQRVSFFSLLEVPFEVPYTYWMITFFFLCIYIPFCLGVPERRRPSSVYHAFDI